MKGGLPCQLIPVFGTRITLALYSHLSISRLFRISDFQSDTGSCTPRRARGSPTGAVPRLHLHVSGEILALVLAICFVRKAGAAYRQECTSSSTISASDRGKFLCQWHCVLTCSISIINDILCGIATSMPASAARDPLHDPACDSRPVMQPSELSFLCIKVGGVRLRLN